MKPLSTTQREVLEKMRDGWHLFGGDGWLEVTKKDEDGEYLFLELGRQLVKEEFILGKDHNGYIEYTITPLGIEALKEK
jgi:hypothetical protein